MGSTTSPSSKPQPAVAAAARQYLAVTKSIASQIAGLANHAPPSNHQSMFEGSQWDTTLHAPNATYPGYFVSLNSGLKGAAVGKSSDAP
jgi:hypothetical protein